VAPSARRSRRPGKNSSPVSPALSGDPQRLDAGRVHLPFGVPHVVGGLHPQPHPGAIAEQLAQANRNGGGDRLALFQDVVTVSVDVSVAHEARLISLCACFSTRLGGNSRGREPCLKELPKLYYRLDIRMPGYLARHDLFRQESTS
jgi:hypothetical protein